jgi:hypothetical protein
MFFVHTHMPPMLNVKLSQFRRKKRVPVWGGSAETEESKGTYGWMKVAVNVLGLITLVVM